jgi:hypothetical protein
MDNAGVKTAANRRPDLGWSHRLRRWLVMGVVIAIVVWVAATYGTPVYLQGRLLYVQHLCMTYAESGDRAVYRFDPQISMNLQNTDTSQAGNNVGGADGPAPEDACPDIIPAHISPFGGAGDPRCLEMFNRRLGFVLYDDFQPVFLHALTTPQGKKRLVVVSVGPPTTRAAVSGPVIETLVFDPAGWMGNARMLKRRIWRMADPLLALEPATFLWGNADAADASRFHLRYQRGGKTIVIDGTLDDDGTSASIQ